MKDSLHDSWFVLDVTILVLTPEYVVSGTINVGVSKNRGTPKWMVIMEHPMKMDDLGVPLFSETSMYINFETTVICTTSDSWLQLWTEW